MTQPPNGHCHSPIALLPVAAEQVFVHGLRLQRNRPRRRLPVRAIFFRHENVMGRTYIGSGIADLDQHNRNRSVENAHRSFG